MPGNGNICIQQAGGANPSPVAHFERLVNTCFLIPPIAEYPFAEKNIPVRRVHLVARKHDALRPDAEPFCNADSALQVSCEGSLVLTGLHAVVVGKCVCAYLLPRSPLDLADDTWRKVEGVGFFVCAD